MLGYQRVFWTTDFFAQLVCYMVFRDLQQAHFGPTQCSSGHRATSSSKCPGSVLQNFQNFHWNNMMGRLFYVYTILYPCFFWVESTRSEIGPREQASQAGHQDMRPFRPAIHHKSSQHARTHCQLKEILGVYVDQGTVGKHASWVLSSTLGNHVFCLTCWHIVTNNSSTDLLHFCSRHSFQECSSPAKPTVLRCAKKWQSWGLLARIEMSCSRFFSSCHFQNSMVRSFKRPRGFPASRFETSEMLLRTPAGCRSRPQEIAPKLDGVGRSFPWWRTVAGETPATWSNFDVKIQLQRSVFNCKTGVIFSHLQMCCDVLKVGMHTIASKHIAWQPV